MSKRIYPPAKIGILGGGQLALYMAIEARKMGYEVFTYDPNPNSPSRTVSEFTCGSFNDYRLLEDFCKKCDVVTYEFENMNLDHIRQIDQQFNLPQGSKILEHTAHRYHELLMAKDLGIPTVPSIYIKDSFSDITKVKKLKLPLIVKTCRFGYDGKGQQKIDNYDELHITEESLISEFITFDLEISVILARSSDEIQVYPCFKNKHEKGILKRSETMDENVFIEAKAYAIKIAEKMNYIGVMAVEFFVKDGELIFNEVAPRPHNSGHLTLSVSNKSQFKAHVLAICSMKIGPLYHYEDAVMENILGEDIVEARKLMAEENVDYYEYGKNEIVSGRKMGHVVYTKEAMKKKEIIHIWTREFF